MGSSCTLPHLLLLLLFSSTLASGGPPIFVQSLDLVPLTISLAVLITLTITFEVGLHTLKHKYEKDPVIGAVIHKINAEFTVLGFVSIIALLFLQGGGPKIFNVENHVAEFEVAHVWLFFVGCMYVVEALVFLHQAVHVSSELSEYDALSNANVMHSLHQQRDDNQKKSVCTIFRKAFRCFGCREVRHFSKGISVDPQQAAEHIMRGFFFKQLHHKRIHKQLGLQVVLFDFSKYMAEFWRREGKFSIVVHKCMVYNVLIYNH